MLYLRKTFGYEYPLDEAQVAVIGIPWDSTGLGMSTRHGPLFIREAIRDLAGYCPRRKANPFRDLRLTDLGDVEVVQGSWELTSAAIADTVRHVIGANPKVLPIFLGGEHLITLPIVKELLSIRKGLTVVQLDAHRDLMPDWMGNPYSHITWANHALKLKGLELVQLGARSWSQEEQPLIERVRESMDGMEGPAYLTVDLDVLDPRHAPEVGTPEPRGLNLDEVLSLVRKASGKGLVGMDIVECASRSVGSGTALMAAHVFREALFSIGRQHEG